MGSFVWIINLLFNWDTKKKLQTLSTSLIWKKPMMECSGAFCYTCYSREVSGVKWRSWIRECIEKAILSHPVMSLRCGTNTERWWLSDDFFSTSRGLPIITVPYYLGEALSRELDYFLFYLFIYLNKKKFVREKWIAKEHQGRLLFYF